MTKSAGHNNIFNSSSKNDIMSLTLSMNLEKQQQHFLMRK